MTDLAVAHVGIRRKSDRKAVRLEACPGVLRVKSVEMLRHRGRDGIPFLVLAKTHAIHDDEHDRSLPVDLSVSLQCFNHIIVQPSFAFFLT